MIRYIDMENYPRKSHFEYFGSLAYPYVGFTANVDVTNPIRFAKERGASTFLAVLYVAIQAANAVPELRQRIVDGKSWNLTIAMLALLWLCRTRPSATATPKAA